MITLDCQHSFAKWREQARLLLSHNMQPSQVNWDDAASMSLLPDTEVLPTSIGTALVKVPAELIDLLEQASCYRGEQRWNLLFRILWRVSRGDRTAMLAGDQDGSELHKRIKQVRREAHHLHAFLRFNQIVIEGSESPGYVAWHEPIHDILRSASSHFIDRMGQCSWLIATPEDGVFYDGNRLHYQRTCPADWQQLAKSTANLPSDLWLTYYQHIFNPARVNGKVTQQHMPVRFWKNLPEGPAISRLIHQARHGKQCDGQAASIQKMPGKRIASSQQK